MSGAAPAEASGTWSVQTAPLPIGDPLSGADQVEVPPFGPRPQYLQSSQARHWMFSAEELAQLRSQANQQAAETLKQYASDDKVCRKLIQELVPTILSVEEELAIIRFYLLRIGRLVRAFHLPSLVESTAMTLMKRFYLRNSCMQFHPKLIMYVFVLIQAHKHLPRIQGGKLSPLAVQVLCPSQRGQCWEAGADRAICSTRRCFGKYHQGPRVRYGTEPGF